jgi:nucleoside-diphosphate-sugar epimerase
MRVLILGCGYVGLPLGTELARGGHEVFGVKRTPDDGTLAAAGIQPVVGDITATSSLADLLASNSKAVAGDFDWVVNTLSSSKGGVEEYRAVYLETTRRLIQWLTPTSIRKFVYTSSTSVYGQTDGSEVTEASSTEPASETSRLLVQTEQCLLQAARESNFPAVVLRVAGIYGPERGHLFQQYLRGEARLHGDGSRLINMVHRDDVVSAIVAALERGRGGEIYNVADDEAVMQREFFTWLSARLNRPMPPLAAAEENSQRKRGLTQKRVANRKLRHELGFDLRYPTFREGYAAEMRRLGL